MRIHGNAGVTINPNGLSCVYETNSGGRLILRHDGWGAATLHAVRPIVQWEIPTFAGMTWEGMGMTWEGVGMMESPTFCSPGAIHAAK